MKIGFQLLKTRTIEDRIDLKSLEQSYQIHLPPLFKVFVQTFYLNTILYEHYVYDGGKKSFPLLTIVYQPDEEVCFMEFTSLEESLREWEEIEYDEDLPFLKRVLPFAETAWGYSVSVGLEGIWRDKIVFEDQKEKDRYRILADNIFEFVRGLALIELKRGVNYSEIYKNWEDHFWRVKGEEYPDEIVPDPPV